LKRCDRISCTGTDRSGVKSGPGVEAAAGAVLVEPARSHAGNEESKEAEN
jgi:hypothetical protein